MKTYDLDSDTRALVEAACDLYSAIGHDICTGDDRCVEDDEVADVLQDRLRDWLLEHGTAFVAVWDALTPSKKRAICEMAL